jgi:hypothetical protein
MAENSPTIAKEPTIFISVIPTMPYLNALTIYSMGFKRVKVFQKPVNNSIE